MTLAGRLLGLSLMVALWLQGRGGAENLILVLFLCVLCLARWRFPRMPVWTVVFDQAACGVAMSAWPDAAFGLVIPILDSSAAGVMWLALPALAIVFARGSWSVPLPRLSPARCSSAGPSGYGRKSWKPPDTTRTAIGANATISKA